MFQNTPTNPPGGKARSLDERLLSLFNGLNGFGLVVYYWLLVGSLVGSIVLIAVGFSYWQWWCVLLGLLAIRCYAHIGHIGQEILERMAPYDG